MKDRRWDIVLRVVSGPLASRTPVAHRGPQVVVGVDPGPGGVVLPGGRGVAPRHCSVTAYDPHTVFVTPIGHNPVRIAPYAEVRWDQLEPVRGQVRLERGNAIHLGPTGQRGVTLEFVECRDLGMQSVVRLASEGVADGSILPRPPDAILARVQRPRVRSLLADAVPSTTYRWALLAMLGSSGVMLLAAAVLVLVRVSMTAAEQPPESWEAYTFDWSAGDLTVHDGFDEPLFDFVVHYNRNYARGVEDERHDAALDADHPEQWDQRFFFTVVQLARRTSSSPHFFKRLEQVHDDYARVLQLTEEVGLPEVFAAIPMLESCYRATMVSPCCAKGYWQWMPEAGPRFSETEDFGPKYGVRGCTYKSQDKVRFTPKAKAPRPFACRDARYVANGRCDLGACDVDFRTDLEMSTRASLHSLADAMDDEILAGSGSVVQIAIATHHAGYDDRMYIPDAPKKPMNLIHAYKRWWKVRGAAVPAPHFYGDAMLCDQAATDDELGQGCQRYMMVDTQRYAPRIIADHLLAVCFYAANHPEIPQFARWSRYLREGGYCQELDIPNIAELRGVKVDGWCH